MYRLPSLLETDIIHDTNAFLKTDVTTDTDVGSLVVGRKVKIETHEKMKVIITFLHCPCHHMSDQHKWMDEHKYVNTTSNHVTTLHFGNEYRELSRAIHVTSQPFKSSIVLLTLGNITSMTLPSFKTILNHSSNCC